MGIGALFVAIITMYSAVASRTREIATLRALGFRGGPVVISVLIESMILAARRRAAWARPSPTSASTATRRRR